MAERERSREKPSEKPRIVLPHPRNSPRFGFSSGSNTSQPNSPKKVKRKKKSVAQRDKARGYKIN